MTTIAHHRAQMGQVAITALVTDHLDRWAAEVDRLKGLNAGLVKALETLAAAEIGEPSLHAKEYERQVKEIATAALDTMKGEA